MNAPLIKLSDNQQMPQLGLGLWQVKDDQQFKTAFNSALTTGYTHFDTAQAYGNEQMLGEAWRNSKRNREDLFITTKIMVTHFSPKKLRSSFDESLKKLQTDYVNLLLLHFPVTIQRKKAWACLEDLKTSGLVKSIGVSNYTIRHLEEMKSYAREMPVVNQVELHVFLQQPELISYCKENKIQVEAYSPLARAHIMDNPVIKEIANNHQKTYAQVMLRFLLQQDLVVIPKSVTPGRIEENYAALNFSLSEEEMAELKKLDQDKRFCWSPVHVP